MNIVEARDELLHAIEQHPDEDVVPVSATALDVALNNSVFYEDMYGLPEVNVMARCLHHLESLNLDEQVRVVEWLSSRVHSDALKAGTVASR